jgi:hypothetical protein
MLPWAHACQCHLTEKGAEGFISSPSLLVTWHLVIELDAMFQVTKLPAGTASHLEMNSYMMVVS